VSARDPAGGRVGPRFIRTLLPWFVGAVFFGFIGVLGLGAALNGDVPPAGRVASALLACGCVGVLVVTWRAGGRRGRCRRRAGPLLPGHLDPRELVTGHGVRGGGQQEPVEQRRVRRRGGRRRTEVDHPGARDADGLQSPGLPVGGRTRGMSSRPTVTGNRGVRMSRRRVPMTTADEQVPPVWVGPWRGLCRVTPGLRGNS